MAQQSAFFDSVNGDRPYASADFARVFRSLVRRDGIVAGDGDMLAVSATSPPSLDVMVGLGSAWIQGRHYHLYGTPEFVQVPQPHASLPRIDRVVVRMDTAQAARKIEVYIKPGTPAASPVPPSLTRDTEAWEISLAQIYVVPGATQITNDDITDERYDDEVCGVIGAYGEQEITRTVQTVAELRELTSIHAGETIFLHGYHYPGDGGGGILFVDTDDTTTPDNGGTVFVTDQGARIKRIYSGPISVLWFGARRDGLGDSASAFQAAIDALGTLGGEVFIPAGTYVLGSTVTINQGVQLLGENRHGSRIRAAATFSAGPILRMGDNTGPVRDCVLAHVVVENPENADDVIGLAIYQGRDCKVLHCAFYGLATGILIHGGDSWASGNTIVEPNMWQCKIGIDIDADDGHEANSSLILGGILVGDSVAVPDTIGIIVRKGNTNLIMGTDVEGYDKGIVFASTDALGNRAVMARLEACNILFELAPGTRNNMIIGSSFGVTDNSGNRTNFILQDGQIQMGERPIRFGEMALERLQDNMMRLDNGDLLFSMGRGPVVVDPETTIWYRIGVNNGMLSITPL